MYTKMKEVAHKLRAAISVAGFAVMLNVSAAQAADVENYEATAEFAKQIANCYNMAPPALLALVGNPQVIVVKDFTTFAKIDSVVGRPAGYVQQFANKSFAARAMIGNKSSGVVRSIIFHEDKLKHETTYYTCHVVYHELMHLYDEIKYSSAGREEKSDRPEFQEAYKADVIQANAYLNKLTITKDQQKLIDHYRYFMSKSVEAFAEVGAIILYLHPQSRHYKNIDFLFPRLMARVRDELTLDKIIATGHMGKVKNHLRFPIRLTVTK